MLSGMVALARVHCFVANSVNFALCIAHSGRTIWIADAHRDDGKRFVVHADEKLTAFVDLESQLAIKGMAF
jgi:hypothetical protein